METPEPLPEPAPELGPVAQRWPIHQRLIGAALRAAIMFLGTLPFAFWILHKQYNWDWDWLIGVLVVGLCGFVLLAFEARGSAWWKVSLRLFAAGTSVAVVFPMASVWLDNIGDPSAAYRQLTQVLRPRNLLLAALSVLGFGLSFVLLGLWIYVRNRTARALPHMLAGTVTVLVPAMFLLSSANVGAGWAFWLMTAGLLVPLAAWQGDRVARRFDPAAPQPTEEDVRLTFAVAAPILWVAISVPLGMSAHIPYGTNPTRNVPGSLDALSRAQTSFQGGVGNGEFAGSLPELIQTSDYGREGLGVRTGYVYRLIRGRSNPREAWAAAADPVEPGYPHYVINHKGVVYRSESAVPLDPDGCGLPSGLERAR